MGAQKGKKARALAVAGLVLSWGVRASAGGPLGPQGTPINTSQYGVDLFQGPVLASSRITALGGAYTAVAEGAEGISFNPAAASLRAPYSTTRFDYDLTGSITFPASVDRTDFDNNGRRGFAYDRFVWGSAGGYVQYDDLGIGAIVSGQNYNLGAPTSPTPLPGQAEIVGDISVRLLKADIVASYGFLDGQLHIGGGLRSAFLFVVGDAAPIGNPGGASERNLFDTNALGLQGGILWAPYHLPLRLGGAVRSPLLSSGVNLGAVVDQNAAGDRVVGHLHLPEGVDLPWEVEIGGALQLGDRPLNLKWKDEDKVPDSDIERWRKTGEDDAPAARRMLKTTYREVHRRKVMLATSLLVSGPVRNAVGLESMLEQKQIDRSGQRTTLSARAGIEAEVIPWWLVLRAGSYLEPSRFRESDPRLHGTAGVQVRLFKWDVFGLFDEHAVWRLSGAVDVARDYFGWGLGLGLFI